MNKPEDDAQWTRMLTEHLDAGCRDLDAPTRSRLNQARQRALAEARRPLRTRWTAGLLAASALSVAMAVMLWTQAPIVPPPPMQSSLSAEDFEMLANDGNADFYEDLEFYAWLDAQQPASG